MNGGAKLIFVLVILALFFVLSGDSFISWKNSLSYSVNKAFFSLKFVGSFLKADGLETENQELRVQNEALKTELLKAGFKGQSGWLGAYQYQTARVYSTYPFNFRHLLTIDRGVDSDFTINMPVLIKGGLLLGQIQQISAKYSVIKTIFDPSWEMPVKIGVSGVDGLLTGGPSPNISLIDKKRNLQVGDSVYSSGVGFSYGTAVGSVGKLFPSEGELVKKAELALPYQRDSFSEVSVVLNYNP